MNKKADIWISAVIYIGLAITILTIVLAAGMPVINKLRDKNIEIQTRDVMSSLDDTIRTVVKEGPGSRRTPVIKINRGEFKIDEDQNEIVWTLSNSKFMFSQPDIEISEGNLKINTAESNVKGEYIVTISSSYADTGLRLNPQINVLSGQYNLVITNEGSKTDSLTIPPTTYIDVSIKELTT